jgi:Cof subfamily protein (haloacid dehalogenase superfamily)
MKSGMYKLFITDLDGTLLDDRKTIPQANLEALKRLVTDDIHITVFTGRNYHSAKPFIDALGIDIPVVFQNGAFIMNPRSQEILYQSGLGSSEASAITRIAFERGFDAIVYKGFMAIPDMLIQRTEWNGSPYEPYVLHNHYRTEFVPSILDRIRDTDTISQLAIIGKQDALTVFEREMRERFRGTISPIYSSVISGTGFLEFFGPDVSKGIALQKVLERFHITPEETVFIGDNYNDVELMEIVGLPVAVDNSPEFVKKLCRLVVANNNDAGVADAVQRIFYS